MMTRSPRTQLFVTYGKRSGDKLQRLDALCSSEVPKLIMASVAPPRSVAETTGIDAKITVWTDATSGQRLMPVKLKRAALSAFLAVCCCGDYVGLLQGLSAS